MPVTQRRFGRIAAKKIVEINSSRNDKACDGQLLDNFVQQSKHLHHHPSMYESCRIFAIASCLRFIANHIKPTFLPTFASEFTAKYSINRSILVNINWIGVWHVKKCGRPFADLTLIAPNYYGNSPQKAFLCVHICPRHYIDGLQPKKNTFCL